MEKRLARLIEERPVLELQEASWRCALRFWGGINFKISNSLEPVKKKSYADWGSQQSEYCN